MGSEMCIRDRGKIVVKGFVSLKKYAEERGWAEEATEVHVPQVEKKKGKLKSPPAPRPPEVQDPISLQKALDWVRDKPVPELAKAAASTEVATTATKTPPPPPRTQAEATAAPTATTKTQQPPKTPPQRVKPSVTIETTPEKACADPEKHVWEPQTSGAYVKTGRLGGLSCIGACGRKFVDMKPQCERARAKEFQPSVHKPAQLCRTCSRGVCFDCHLSYTSVTTDGGRRYTRSRGDP